MDELQDYVGSWYKDTVGALMAVTKVGTSTKLLSGHDRVARETPRIGSEDVRDAGTDQMHREVRRGEREKMETLQDRLRSLDEATIDL